MVSSSGKNWGGSAMMIYEWVIIARQVSWDIILIFLGEFLKFLQIISGIILMKKKASGLIFGLLGMLINLVKVKF